MALDYESIRKTIRHMNAQTAREQLELVIVTTPEKVATINREELEGLGAFQIVTVPDLRVGAFGWAQGIRKATAEVVVLAEDHSFPEPEWVANLIEAHQEQSYTAVAPVVHNGNPATLTSWANYLMCFLDWHAPEGNGLVPAGPGHNTSYKRDQLLNYRERLPEMLKSEKLLHTEFGTQGKRIYLWTGAATHHVNISRFASFLSHSFHGGRIFGAGRRVNWPWWKRIVYAGGFFLVPPLRWGRMYVALNSPAKRARAHFWAATPLLAIGLAVHAFGEAVGYLIGPGDSIETYMQFEMLRSMHVTAGDRGLLRI